MLFEVPYGTCTYTVTSLKLAFRYFIRQTLAMQALGGYNVAVSVCYVITVYRYNTNSFQFPKISGKLSACASGYQALSFPAH